MPSSSQRHVTGVSPLDSHHEKKNPPVAGGFKIEASIVIDRPAEVCYRYWRNFANLSSFLNHVQSVEILDDRRSHWVVKGPADTTVEWDAEIIEDIPGERLSWRSLENAQVDNAGSVQFQAEEGGKTDVKVVLTYNPPMGALGLAFAKLFGENPETQLNEDLTLFKETLEKLTPTTPDNPAETHLD